MDLRTHTATRSMRTKENGRAIDEPVELKNLVVNSASVGIYEPHPDLSMVNCIPKWNHHRPSET